MNGLSQFPPVLDRLKNLVFDKLNLQLTNLSKETESSDYAAYAFELNQRKVIFRTARITPKKNGQFVALWKRSVNGETQTYDLADQIDFVIINTETVGQFGQFVFPQHILLSKGIFSENRKGGKRGIRVYPPWDKPESKQAEKTQAWQTRYFVKVCPGDEISLNFLKKVYELDTLV